MKITPKPYIRIIIYYLLRTPISLNSLAYRLVISYRQGKYNYPPLHKKKKETGSERLRDKPEVTQLVTIKRGVVCLRVQPCFPLYPLHLLAEHGHGQSLGWQCPPAKRNNHHLFTLTKGK